jgi:hypothetical protein
MIRRSLADADLNRAIVTGVIRRNAYLDFKRAEATTSAHITPAQVWF